MNDILLHPIAYVKNTRPALSDDYWGELISEIELIDSLPAAAFDGIENFSHLEVLFYFHKSNPENKVLFGRPRENPQWPVTGIFAQRKKDRPNNLGTTIVKLNKRVGNKLYVENLDAIDTTPVLDIKPVFKEFLPAGEIVQPPWSIQLMANYWNKK